MVFGALFDSGCNVQCAPDESFGFEVILKTFEVKRQSQAIMCPNPKTKFLGWVSLKNPTDDKFVCLYFLQYQLAEFAHPQQPKQRIFITAKN